jgi:soluble lytic murein transglycosylase-like protein
VNINDIEGIQNILQRMRDISSIEVKIESESQKFLQKSDEKPEFLKELEKVNREKSLSPVNTTGLQNNKPEQNPQKILSNDFAREQKQNHTKKFSLNDIIERESKSKGLDPDLVKAIIKAESNFNPKAESPAGAQGLMQLMPDTAEMLGVDNPFNALQNIKGGTSYLKNLMQTFKKKDLAIAAYNAGPGAIKKFKGIPPYSETQNYVQKVKDFYEDYKD